MEPINSTQKSFAERLLPTISLTILIFSVLLYIFGYTYIYFYFWYFNISLQPLPLQLSDIILPILTYWDTVLYMLISLLIGSIVGLLTKPKEGIRPFIFTMGGKIKIIRIIFSVIFFGLPFLMIVFSIPASPLPVKFSAIRDMFICIFFLFLLNLNFIAKFPRLINILFLFFIISAITANVIESAKQNGKNMWNSNNYVYAEGHKKYKLINSLSNGIVGYEISTNHVSYVPWEKIENISIGNKGIKSLNISIFDRFSLEENSTSYIHYFTK